MGDLNNRLLFSLLFSGNFCGGQGFDGGGQSHDRGSHSPPLSRENPEHLNNF